MDFLTTNNLILIPVLICLGFAIKSSKLISDNYIPFILIALGCILGWLNQHNIDGVLQGIICSSLAMGIYDSGKMVYKARLRDGK